MPASEGEDLLRDVELNGRFATGAPWAEKLGDRQSSSSCLAWSETWVRPKS